MDTSIMNNMNSNNGSYPKKKFSIHDIVTIEGRGGTFHIYAEPSWSNEYNQWLYPYDYGLGGASEGYGLEKELKLFKRSKN